MRDLRLETVADDVVAWHNRHPLARRIGVEHVHSIGYVVLPFVPLVVAGDGAAGAGASDAAGSAIPATRVDPSGLTPPGMVTLTDVVQAAVAGDALTPDPPQAPQPPRPKLRDRAVARARQLAGQGVSPPATEPGAAPVQADAAAALAGAGAWPAKALRAIFSEAFFEHASVKQVARWASRHGRQTLARLNGPTRVVPEDPGLLAAFKGSDQHPDAGLPLQLVLRTATIESGSVRLRLLLGPGAAPAVLGPRWWSGPRLLGTGLASVAVLGFALTLQCGALPDVHLATPHETVAPTQPTQPTQASADIAPTELAAGLAQQALPQAWAEPSSVAASGVQAPDPSSAVAEVNGAATSAGSGLALAPTLTTPAATTANAAAAAAAAASAAAAVSAAAAASAATTAPIDVDPRLGQINLPSLGPFFDQPAVAASRARRLADQTLARRTQMAMAAATQEPPALGAAAASSPGMLDPKLAASGAAAAIGAAAAAGGANPSNPGSPSAMDSAPPVVATAKVPAVLPAVLPAAVPKFALTTRLLRTPAETEQLAAAMRTLLSQQGNPAVQVEVVPVGPDWRVVGWPFVERGSADKARSFLAARGMRVEVIDF